jgi:hypothetical protein
MDGLSVEDKVALRQFNDRFDAALDRLEEITTNFGYAVEAMGVAADRLEEAARPMNDAADKMLRAGKMG